MFGSKLFSIGPQFWKTRKIIIYFISPSGKVRFKHIVSISIDIETICLDVYGILKSYNTTTSPLYEVILPSENNRKMKVNETITGSVHSIWKLTIIPNLSKLLNNIAAQSAFLISRIITCRECNKIINPNDRYIDDCCTRQLHHIITTGYNQKPIKHKYIQVRP